MAGTNRKRLRAWQKHVEKARSMRSKKSKATKPPAPKRRRRLVTGGLTPAEFANWWWEVESVDLHPNNPGDRELMLLGPSRWDKPECIRRTLHAIERTLLRQNPAFNREPLAPDVEEDFKEYRSILLERLDELVSVDCSLPPRQLSRRRKQRKRTGTAGKPEEISVWDRLAQALEKAQQAVQIEGYTPADRAAAVAVWNRLPEWIQSSSTLLEADTAMFSAAPHAFRETLSPIQWIRVTRELKAAWRDHLKRHPEDAVEKPAPKEPEMVCIQPDRRKPGKRKPKQKVDVMEMLQEAIDYAYHTAKAAGPYNSSRDFGMQIYYLLPQWMQETDELAHTPYATFTTGDCFVDELANADVAAHNNIRQQLTRAWREERKKVEQVPEADRVPVCTRILARRKPLPENCDDHAARVARRRKAAQSRRSS